MQKNKINTSIIIAVYNAEKRLEQVIKSLLSQEYDKPYEIILVDDGSTDDSLNIMQSSAKKHKKIKVIHQKNKGAASARNLGIKKAKGKYLVISDDDVLLEKKWLKKTMPLLEDKNVGSISSMIKNVPLRNLNYIQKLLFDYAMASRFTDLNDVGFMFMSNAIKKEAIEKSGLYDEDFGGSGAGADLDLMGRITHEGYTVSTGGAPMSKAIGIHLEEKNRFKLSFFIKKPYTWGQASAKFANKIGIMTVGMTGFALLFPIVPLSMIIPLALYFFSPFFLFIYVLNGIIYFLFRKKMLICLAERKRNMVEIILISILDMFRVAMYNLGALNYFFLKK